MNVRMNATEVSRAGGGNVTIQCHNLVAGGVPGDQHVPENATSIPVQVCYCLKWLKVSLYHLTPELCSQLMARGPTGPSGQIAPSPARAEPELEPEHVTTPPHRITGSPALATVMQQRNATHKNAQMPAGSLPAFREWNAPQSQTSCMWRNVAPAHWDLKEMALNAMMWTR